MLQPKWIAGLVFALMVAGAFAWLGQWQLERAVESGTVVKHPTEAVMPLQEAAKPGSPLHTKVVGQLVEATGSFVPEDYLVIGNRDNDGPRGYWVTGHFVIDSPDASGPVSLAVARGWAPTKKKAQEAAAELSAKKAEPVTLTGRLLSSEAPVAPPRNGDPFAMTAMSVAAFYNLWHDVDGQEVYTAYVVEHGTPPAGLTAIYSPPPIEKATINWLNIFYAAEWAVFAGFAVFLWYRVVRDAWEREAEDAALSEQEPSAENVN